MQGWAWGYNWCGAPPRWLCSQTRRRGKVHRKAAPRTPPPTAKRAGGRQRPYLGVCEASANVPAFRPFHWPGSAARGCQHPNTCSSHLALCRLSSLAWASAVARTMDSALMGFCKWKSLSEASAERKHQPLSLPSSLSPASSRPASRSSSQSLAPTSHDDASESAVITSTFPLLVLTDNDTSPNCQRPPQGCCLSILSSMQ